MNFFLFSMFNLILIILFLIFTKLGLINLIEVIILTFILFIIQVLLGLNPYKWELQIIKLIAIALISWILIQNWDDSTLSFVSTGCKMMILPFSKDKISYLEDFPGELNFNPDNYQKFRLLNELNHENIESFMKILDPNKNYVLLISFLYDDRVSYLTISEPILLNKYSNSKVIFDYMENKFYLFLLMFIFILKLSI